MTLFLISSAILLDILAFMSFIIGSLGSAIRFMSSAEIAEKSKSGPLNVGFKIPKSSKTCFICLSDSSFIFLY